MMQAYVNPNPKSKGIDMTKKTLILAIALLLPTIAQANEITNNMTNDIATELFKRYGVGFLILTFVMTVLVKLALDWSCKKFGFMNQKKLENCRALNEKVNNISKTQFEAEFKMYQEISGSMFEMVLNVTSLYPLEFVPGEAPTREEKIEKHKKAQNTLMSYQNMIFKYAPFLNKKMFDMFENLRRLCSQQIKICYTNDLTNPRKEPVIKDDPFQRTDQIQKLHEKIFTQLREYLSSLKVA